MNNKIGVAIITKDRNEFFKQCFDSIDLSVVDRLVVVNDGLDLPTEFKTQLNNNKTDYILNEKNLGVSKTKNKAFKNLLNHNCEHIFIVEDDCVVKNNQIWNKYIEAYQTSKIPHFNYGPGSPWNRKQEDPSIIGDLSKRHLATQIGEPMPKLIVQYSKTISLAFYEHVVAMFSYFHSSILNKVGLLNEEYFNAWEHVSHTYDIIKAGYHTPFWWFADLADSHKYLEEAKNEKANTSLAKDEEQFFNQVIDGLKIFRLLHNTVPSQIPKATEEEVIAVLKKIKS